MMERKAKGEQESIADRIAVQRVGEPGQTAAVDSRRLTAAGLLGLQQSMGNRATRAVLQAKLGAGAVAGAFVDLQHVDSPRLTEKSYAAGVTRK